MSDRIYGQCPQCGGSLFIGHRCPFDSKKNMEKQGMSDTCPFCGAGSNKEDYPYSENYKCGTFWRDGKPLRSRPECYNAELSQLRIRIAELEAVAEAALSLTKEISANLQAGMGEKFFECRTALNGKLHAAGYLK